jgi:hypothetical protein
MDHVNVHLLYDLAVNLEEVKYQLITDEPFIVFGARYALHIVQLFLHGDFIPLDGANEVELRAAADQLRSSLEVLVNHCAFKERDAPVSQKVKDAVAFSMGNFKSRLELDAGRLSLYFVPQRLAYDTRTLLDDAVRAFIAPAILPDEAKADIMEAGRCLAFQLPTAVAFHMLRATEGVIRLYLWLLGGVIPEEPNWQKYIDAVGATGKAPRHTVARLHRLRDLERNQLMHVTTRPLLTIEEGAELFEYAKDAINAMSLHISRLFKEAQS